MDHRVGLHRRVAIRKRAHIRLHTNKIETLNLRAQCSAGCLYHIRIIREGQLGSNRHFTQQRLPSWYSVHLVIEQANFFVINVTMITSEANLPPEAYVEVLYRNVTLGIINVNDNRWVFFRAIRVFIESGGECSEAFA